MNQATSLASEIPKLASQYDSITLSFAVIHTKQNLYEAPRVWFLYEK